MARSCRTAELPDWPELRALLSGWLSGLEQAREEVIEQLGGVLPVGEFVAAEPVDLVVCELPARSSAIIWTQRRGRRAAGRRRSGGCRRVRSPRADVGEQQQRSPFAVSMHRTCAYGDTAGSVNRRALRGVTLMGPDLRTSIP